MTPSFRPCEAWLERYAAEFMQSKTEGVAALNDAIFPAMRSVAGKICGGIYAEQDRRCCGVK